MFDFILGVVSGMLLGSCLLYHVRQHALDTALLGDLRDTYIRRRAEMFAKEAAEERAKQELNA